MTLEGTTEFTDAVINAIKKMNLKHSKEFPGDNEKIIRYSGKGTVENIRLTIDAMDPMLFYTLGVNTAEYLRELTTK